MGQFLRQMYLVILIVCLSSNVAGGAESWTRLYIGQTAVMTDGGVYSSSKVCSTAEEVFEYDFDKGPRCKIEVLYGSLVRILNVRKYDTPGWYNEISDAYYVVEVQNLSGSWSGWTELNRIMPAIPSGTILRLATNDMSGEPHMYPELLPGAQATIALGAVSTARVLSQLGTLCEIEILSGSKRGKVGYIDCGTFGATKFAPDGIKFTY